MGAAIPEFRTPVMTRVEVSWDDPTGATQTVPARMEDKSSGGACIRVKTPIQVGSKVTIRWRFEQFSGTVKYCRSDEREYLVGIQRDAAQIPTPNPIPIPKPSAATDHSPQKITTKSDNSSAAPVEIPANRIVRPAVASQSKTTPVRRMIREDSLDDFPAARRDFRTLRRAEVPTKEPPREARKEKERERNPMPRKWLELPWSKKPEDLGPSLLAASAATGVEDSTVNREKENHMSHPTQPAAKAPAYPSREVQSFQVELAPMEDIYRAAGIMLPRKGYSIKKIVDMLNSEHMAGLNKDMKRVALLMALDAAGVPLDEVLQDAKSRQQALDAYEAAQKKQVEAEWARKAEEVVQIQAELESIKAHYAARISRNMEGVAREKATFNNWLTMKQQECQAMAEAAELCSKYPAAETATAPQPEVSPAKAAAVAAAAAGSKPESRSDAIH